MRNHSLCVKLLVVYVDLESEIVAWEPVSAEQCIFEDEVSETRWVEIEAC